MFDFLFEEERQGYGTQIKKLNYDLEKCRSLIFTQDEEIGKLRQSLEFYKNSVEEKDVEIDQLKAQIRGDHIAGEHCSSCSNSYSYIDCYGNNSYGCLLEVQCGDFKNRNKMPEVDE